MQAEALSQLTKPVSARRLLAFKTCLSPTSYPLVTSLRTQDTAK
jgi:hypothetical protein